MNCMANLNYLSIYVHTNKQMSKIFYLSIYTHIADGNGAWSTEGCTTNGRDADGKVIGRCNHLTTFAVLNVSCGSTYVLNAALT